MAENENTSWLAATNRLLRLAATGVLIANVAVLVVCACSLIRVWQDGIAAENKLLGHEQQTQISCGIALESSIRGLRRF